MDNLFYVENPFSYKRRETWDVKVGNLLLGSNFPIRVQSMTNVSTLDTLKCVEQIVHIVDNGADMVRVATPSVSDAENLKNIKEELLKRKYNTPLIADIHFNPKIAETAALFADKIRINPGNYQEKSAGKQHFTEKEYEEAIEQIHEKLYPLLKICNEHETAIRIGTNHGSLSNRILDRYGNTPMGMAISAMEFVAICYDFGFKNLVLSMKSSNIGVMIQSVRLLVAMLDEKSWKYPLHLGVTEAGNGEYGRLKSAAGIAPLLYDGIGDTLRVSLTEAPECEIPFANILAKQIPFSTNTLNAEKIILNYNPYTYKKRETFAIEKIGGNNKPIIVSNNEKIKSEDISEKIANKFDFTNDIMSVKNNVLVHSSKEDCSVSVIREFICRLIQEEKKNPVIIKRSYNETDWETFYAKATGDFSCLLVDGLIDGIWIENPHFSNEKLYQLSLQILQACQLRFSNAEYIACPSCGRTQYDIEKVLGEIKRRTSHLSNLKIGVMGCIVNGPGEMADADYGFVGSGNKKITLYKGQEVVSRNIPEEMALDKLIKLIKDNGDWIEP